MRAKSAKSVEREAVRLLEAAVAKIESKGLREWALSAHNRPIWTDYVKALVAKQGKSANNVDDVLRLSTYMTCVGIGA